MWERPTLSTPQCLACGSFPPKSSALKHDLCSALKVSGHSLCSCAFWNAASWQHCGVSWVKVGFGSWKDQHDSEINHLCFWDAAAVALHNYQCYEVLQLEKVLVTVWAAGENTETFKMAA